MYGISIEQQEKLFPISENSYLPRLKYHYINFISFYVDFFFFSFLFRRKKYINYCECDDKATSKECFVTLMLKIKENINMEIEGKYRMFYKNIRIIKNNLQ